MVGQAARSPSVVGAVVWWESRRLLVNLLVGTYGLACLLALYGLVRMADALPPGEDVVEPAGVMVAGLGFNVCYTMGWIVEVVVRVFVGARSPGLGPAMMKAGLGFSVVVMSLPVVIWVGLLCLRMVGVVG